MNESPNAGGNTKTTEPLLTEDEALGIRPTIGKVEKTIVQEIQTIPNPDQALKNIVSQNDVQKESSDNDPR